MDKFKCDVCNGKGEWPILLCYNNYQNVYTGKLNENYIYNNEKAKYKYRKAMRQCPACYGKGYLDWIENIRGCGKDPIGYFPPSCDSLRLFIFHIGTRQKVNGWMY